LTVDLAGVLAVPALVTRLHPDADTLRRIAAGGGPKLIVQRPEEVRETFDFIVVSFFMNDFVRFAIHD
jgi:hypothetical protein